MSEKRSHGVWVLRQRLSGLNETLRCPGNRKKTEFCLFLYFGPLFSIELTCIRLKQYPQWLTYSTMASCGRPHSMNPVSLSCVPSTCPRCDPANIRLLSKHPSTEPRRVLDINSECGGEEGTVRSDAHNRGHRKDWPRQITCQERAFRGNQLRKGYKDSVTGSMWRAEEAGLTRYPCPHRAVVFWGNRPGHQLPPHRMVDPIEE